MPGWKRILKILVEEMANMIKYAGIDSSTTSCSRGTWKVGGDTVREPVREMKEDCQLDQVIDFMRGDKFQGGKRKPNRIYDGTAGGPSEVNH